MISRFVEAAQTACRRGRCALSGQVDHAVLPSGTVTYFFRGNMPVNDSTSPPTFAYDDLLQYEEEAGWREWWPWCSFRAK